MFFSSHFEDINIKTSVFVIYLFYELYEPVKKKSPDKKSIDNYFVVALRFDDVVVPGSDCEQT